MWYEWWDITSEFSMVEVYTTWIMMSVLPAPGIVLTPHRFNIYFNAYLVLFQLPFIHIAFSLSCFPFSLFCIQCVSNCLHLLCILSTSKTWIMFCHRRISWKSICGCVCVCLCKIKSSLTWYNTKSQSCWSVVHEKKMLQFYNKSMPRQRVCSYFPFFYSQITQFSFLAAFLLKGSKQKLY